MKNTSSVITAPTEVQTNSAVGRRKAPSCVKNTAGTPAVSIMVSAGEIPPTSRSTKSDSAASTVTVSRGAEATATGPKSAEPAKSSNRSYVDRFMEIECSDFIIELLGRRLLTENDVRAFVTAVDAGKIDEFSAFLVSWKADRLARDPEDPARRPTSIADFAARYDAISAAVSKHLANEMLSWLDVATGELKGGRQWQFEIPEVWQVFSILRQRSWDNYRELAEQYSGAKDPEASRQARDLMWVAAIIFALYPDCEDNGTVYGSTEARAALMTRCIREPNTAAFFSDIRKAFSIESEDLLGVTLAEVNALRAHITQEISRCRQVIERGGIHIAIATGVIDDSKIWDFIGSTVEHYIASGELKAWAEELSEEWHG